MTKSILFLDHNKTKYDYAAKLIVAGYELDFITRIADIGGSSKKQYYDYDLLIAYPLTNELTRVRSYLDEAFSEAGRPRIDIIYLTDWVTPSSKDNCINLELRLYKNLELDGYYFRDNYPTLTNMLKAVELLIGKAR